VPRFRFVPAVEADIERALRYTRRKFGHAKYLEYAALIEEALEDLAENARSGKLRPAMERRRLLLSHARFSALRLPR
jgi:plasmid stabilization system protein ParE